MNLDSNTMISSTFNPTIISAPQKKTRINKSYVVAFVVALILFVFGIYNLIAQINFIRAWSAQGSMEFVENHAVAVSKDFSYSDALKYLISPTSITLIALVLILMIFPFIRRKISTNKFSNAGVIVLNIFLVLALCLVALFAVLIFTQPFFIFFIGLGLTASDLVPGSSTVIPLVFLIAVILLLIGYSKEKISSIPKKIVGPVSFGIIILVAVGINFI